LKNKRPAQVNASNVKANTRIVRFMMFSPFSLKSRQLRPGYPSGLPGDVEHPAFQQLAQWTATYGHLECCLSSK
jgi:hypothetical protein